MHPLSDAHLKLLRAKEHLDAIDGQIAAFHSRDPYAIVDKYEPETGDYVMYIRVFEEPDPRWGVLVGDFIHNTRSALDYIAEQLVIANGKKPSRYTQFPITRSCEEFRRVKRMYARMDRADIARLEGVQPYNARNPDEAIGPLAWLNELSNRDKHHVLTVPLARMTTLNPGFITSDNDPTSDVMAVNWDDAEVNIGPVKDKTEIFRVPIKLRPGASDPPVMKMNVERSAHVTLGYELSAVNTLTRIYAEVRRVFAGFAWRLGPFDKEI
jgi:hypothetical protein